MNLAETRTHEPLVNKPRVKSKAKPIRNVAKKRVKVNAEYAKLRVQFLKDNPYCQWWLKEYGQKDKWGDPLGVAIVGMAVINGFLKEAPASTEVHHLRGRGKYLLDTSTWLAVSSGAHRKIHEDPATSYEKGYMLPRR